jgi:hypothetical protein
VSPIRRLRRRPSSVQPYRSRSRPPSHRRISERGDPGPLLAASLSLARTVPPVRAMRSWRESCDCFGGSGVRRSFGEHVI